MKRGSTEQEIYKKRFHQKHQKRQELWKILCKGFFQQFVSKDDTVFDVATGYGEFINNIHCRKKIACDINPDSKKYVDKDVQFLLASSTKIPLRANTVDRVFISNFFEHISREEILQTIHGLYRILKPGGRVLVLQPNIRFCQGDYWMFFDHVTPVDDRALSEAFALSHFEEEVKIERFLPFSTKSPLPQSPLFVSLYLHMPFLWRFFGKQSFLVYKKGNS